ncbi:MAG: hypothetical protein R2864_00220 [Syntrophotaleaceae bacterium]
MIGGLAARSRREPLAGCPVPVGGSDCATSSGSREPPRVAGSLRLTAAHLVEAAERILARK